MAYGLKNMAYEEEVARKKSYCASDQRVKQQIKLKQGRFYVRKKRTNSTLEEIVEDIWRVGKN